MLHRQRQRAAVLSLPTLAVIGVVLALLALSVLLQPPRAAGAGVIEAVLAWGQAVLFSAGALVFVVALVVPGRSGALPYAGGAGVAAAPPPAARTAFTLVALGAAADDMRGIEDAEEPAEAVTLLWRWSEQHPDERLVIYGPDGAVLAFRRPSRNAAR